MAQTLANGIVVPNSDGGEAISSTGVAELRAVGTTADSALGALRSTALAAAGDATATAVAASAKADAVAVESVARDDALADEIAGMEGMKYVGTWDPGYVYRINDVVQYAGDAWARLTAGALGVPGESPSNWGLVARKGDGGGFGELNETETIGLYDTVEGSMTQDQVVGLTAALATKRDIAPMVIGQNVNLNDVNTPGEHSQQFTSWATPELNYPGGASPVAGSLFVAANVARTQVTQFYVPFTTTKLDIYMRNFYVTWGAWERIGMASDLAAKANLTHPALYDSGWRNVTSRISVPLASGNLFLRRTGYTVWADFNDVLPANAPADEWHTWASLIPSGFSVPRAYQYFPLAFTGARDSANEANPNTLFNSAQSLGPIRLEPNGRAIVYGGRSGDGLTPLRVRGLVSWTTTDAIPSSLPGTPA